MRRALCCALLLAALSACAGGDDDAAGADVPLMAFDTALVRVATLTDTFPLRVEVAATEDQRAVGLMERTSLAEDAGMVFVYGDDQPAEAGYWMFHTPVPLDIAYLDLMGRIVSIRQMEPCASPAPEFCDTYPPGAPYRSALEVNRGWFERHGVGLGDKVLLPEELIAGSYR